MSFRPCSCRASHVPRNSSTCTSAHRTKSFLSNIRAQCCPGTSAARNIQPICSIMFIGYADAKLDVWRMCAGDRRKADLPEVDGVHAEPVVSLLLVDRAEGRVVRVLPSSARNVEVRKKNTYSLEALAEVRQAVAPAKAGVQNMLKRLDSGSPVCVHRTGRRSACPE
jgi:hypothetical protein